MDQQDKTERTKVRLTGLLVSKGKLLIIHEFLPFAKRDNWNLPGGTLEYDETCEEGLAREMREETGIDVRVCELLYVTDRFKKMGDHVVDLCFRVEYTGGELADLTVSDEGAELVAQARMVPFADLGEYGFSQKFIGLLEAGLPDKGSYQGEFHRFYG